MIVTVLGVVVLVALVALLMWDWIKHPRAIVEPGAARRTRRREPAARDDR